jgi:putative Ig domain-containing protein
MAPGGAGIGQYGGYIGAGGSEGPNCFSAGTSPDEGGTGQKAPTASADGGGGGGGGGICGGSGGKADVGSGGGGGGSGYSAWAGHASSHSLTSGSNSGDGSASVTFTVTTQAPAITSASCMYATSDGSGHFTAGHVTASGIPAPTLSLVNPPSWLGLGNQVITYPASGAATASALLQDQGTVADGQYTVPVEATNSVSSVIQPLSLAIEPGSSPAFVSDNTATATAGTPFDFGVRTASCPAVNDYALQGADTATSSWLTINNETGELSGTPTAAAAGTHTFTIRAPRPTTPTRPTAARPPPGPAARSPSPASPTATATPSR